MTPRLQAIDAMVRAGFSHASAIEIVDNIMAFTG